MLDYIKKLITPDMVSLWIPSGNNRAIDLIRGNHGQCYGTHPNVPVIGVPYNLNPCDALTDWIGGSLSIDTEDKKEGIGSLKNNVAEPVINTSYSMVYDPTGSWDWSAKKYILFWFKCDRVNTAFTYARLYIYDTSNNNRYWNLVFSAGEWTAVKKLLLTGDGQSATPPDLALIDKVSVYYYTKDTTPFYEKIDDLRVAYKPAVIDPTVGWHFDGTDDYIDCGNQGSLAVLQWTFGLWMYRKTDSGVNERLIAKTGASGRDYWLEIYSTDVLYTGFTDTSASSRSITTVETVSFSEWLFVTVTFDGTYIKIYLNDELKKTSANFSAYTPRTSTRSLWLGRMEADYRFNGHIALPFVANKAWSAQQVENFYNFTKGLFSPRG